MKIQGDCELVGGVNTAQTVEVQNHPHCIENLGDLVYVPLGVNTQLLNPQKAQPCYFIIT